MGYDVKAYRGDIILSLKRTQAALNDLDVRVSAGGGGGGGGSVAWGGITGTLSAQTDLQSALNAKADVTGIAAALSGLAPTVHSHAMSDVTGLVTALDGKQDDLVSGTNIKTINGNSLLGSGDLVIGGSFIDGGSAASVFTTGTGFDGGGA